MTVQQLALWGVDPLVDGLNIVGLPAPQGSKRLVGKHLVESSKQVAPWRDAVAVQALGQLGPGWQPLDGPLFVSIAFFLPRPKSKKADRFSIVAPDLDKLVRSTCDALTTAAVWHDDAQVAELHAVKHYVDDARPYPGARISIAILPNR